MRPPRDWLAWAAVWTLALQSPMWLAVGLDSREELSDPTVHDYVVAGWVPWLGMGLAVAVPAAFLLSVLGAGFVRPRRAGLVLGGLSLLVAAVTWGGFIDGDTGGWYVALSALLGAGALVAAALPPPGVRPRGSHDRAPTLALPAVGAALVLAGLFTAWTSWRAGTYGDWHGPFAIVCLLGLGVGGGQVLLGLLVTWWLPRRAWVLRLAIGTGAALVGTLALGTGALALEVMGGVLYRSEEQESVWEPATPLLVAGAGLLATAVAARKGRNDLLGLSLAAATAVGLLALWQDSTWGSVTS